MNVFMWTLEETAKGLRISSAWLSEQVEKGNILCSRDEKGQYIFDSLAIMKWLSSKIDVKSMVLASVSDNVIVVYRAVADAKKAGELKPGPCEVCGSTDKVHGHHENYDRPLDLTWLCPKHHSARHKAMRVSANN